MSDPTTTLYFVGTCTTVALVACVALGVWIRKATRKPAQ